MLWLNFGGPPKSDISTYQITNQSKSSSTSEDCFAGKGVNFGVISSIYVLKGLSNETPQKVTITVRARPIIGISVFSRKSASESV